MATPFMFPPEWANAPQVKFSKSLSVNRTELGIEQRSTQFVGRETVRDYTVSYLVTGKSELRDIEHTLLAALGGTFLIPFYPEPLRSTVTDYEGNFIFTADLPDWSFPVFGPLIVGDLTADAYAPVPGTFTLTGGWSAVRLDYTDWSNYEIVEPVAWLGASPNISVGFIGTFANTIALQNQTFFWMDEVMLVGSPKVSHLTDTVTQYTINWRSIR